VPDEPDEPLVPDEPDEPLVPEEPELPDVPDEPDVPDVPEVLNWASCHNIYSPEVALLTTIL
jgi:hypothetical protein